MSILFQKVKARTASLLGALEGATVADHETSYVAALSSSVISMADWSASEVQDAATEVCMEIAAALIESENPEADTFNVVSSATASGAAVPTSSSGGVPRIGRIRRVKDSTNSRPLVQTTVDRVRDFINSSSAVFSGYTSYFYAIDGAVLLHTRTNVLVEFGGFTRASILVNLGGSDVIPLPDRYEEAIVAGMVARLAIKESQYMDLAAAAAQEYAAQLAMIKGKATEAA